MASQNKVISQALHDRPELLTQLSEFLDYYNQAREATNYQAPNLEPIVEDIARYITELKSILAPTSSIASRIKQEENHEEQPAAKKRRLNDGTNGATTASTSNGTGGQDVLSSPWTGAIALEGVSFSVPQRKKYTLEISNSKKEGIRAVSAGSQTGEFGIPWASVAHVLRLPVPEKAAASHNFCVFPKGGHGLVGDKSAEGYETIVWGAADARKKSDGEGPTESEAHLQNLKKVEAKGIKNAKVVTPSEDEFVSSFPHPMRKSEKQYHVKAHRGSKEGYLFFLPTGIAFVFKKPLLFFSFDAIESIFYSSVLQRTFNLNIAAFPAGSPSDAQSTSIEFSMLDQGDFAGIDAYIKRHGLEDASMSEARRAKKYNINKDKKGEEGGNELQKAEQEANQMADDDDDEEDDENFDPGSEGESEGEGDSSDEEDGGHDGGRGDEGDLAEEELGSEKEDVEDEDEDEDED